MASSSSSSAESNIILTENDIPGASLAGRNPSSLKNEKLKFWLRCRGDSLKGKSYIDNLCFYHRVQEYIKSGRDKIVVDPDPDEIYTKRKTRLSKLPTERSPETSAPKYPSDGWGKSLERMPPFTRAEMNQHIESSGKRVGKLRSSFYSHKLEEGEDIFKGRVP